MRKKMIDEIKEENPMLWDEIKEFTELLNEWGLGRGYALTGLVENPIITSWKITATHSLGETAKMEVEG